MRLGLGEKNETLLQSGVARQGCRLQSGVARQGCRLQDIGCFVNEESRTESIRDGGDRERCSRAKTLAFT